MKLVQWPLMGRMLGYIWYSEAATRPGPSSGEVPRCSAVLALLLEHTHTHTDSALVIRVIVINQFYAI